MNFPGSLHNHSEYSNLKFRDSTNKYREMLDYAVKSGYTTIGFTEHDTFSGAVELETMKKDYPSLKIIQGNEIYLCRNDLTAETVGQNEKFYHFVFLGCDLEGYHQMCEISTRAWMRSFIWKGLRRIPTYYTDLEEIIGKNKGHIIGSTACIGSALGQQLLRYRAMEQTGEPGKEALYQQIKNWITYLAGIFGEDYFYLELQPSANSEQEYVNKQILLLSEELNIPYIITTDAHYLKKEDAPIHAAFLNAQSADREVADFYATTYLMDTKELESYLPYMTQEQLERAYINIQKIADKCKEYSILKPLRIPQLKWRIPEKFGIADKYFNLIPNLKTFWESSYQGDKIMAQMIVNKLEERKDLCYKESYEKINYELDIVWRSSEVNKAHWSAYFLNIQNIIDTVWRAGSIVGPARGSGAGFYLLYLLDIIQVNPMFETAPMYSWRFLNPDRESVLDIDFDISGLRRSQVLKAFREEYGESRVANVATFGREKSKSAIQTAARGLGIDNDEAQYISSLIPSDRGQTRTLHQCYYGDKEKGFEPIQTFVSLMNSEEYQELWTVAQRIENLICRMGIHAGGVIFVDEPFYNSTALMRAPDGTIITQTELHDSERLSLIKYDALSVEAMDKIQITIELLQKHGYIDKNLPLREAYEQTVGVYNLDRTSEKMWDMLNNHEILSIFQMEQASGIKGINTIHPRTLNELATLNSVIRLMSDGEEQPIEKWARYRKNINEWYEEMRQYGLAQDEIEWLSHHSAITEGMCESQEGLMSLVQEPRLGGNSLNFADKCRKGLAKKIGKIFDECQKEYYRNAKEKGCSPKLVSYVWEELLSVQRGYSFNLSHTLSYSIVGLQEMNLAYKYPIIFWNCANLIVNSGSLESESSSTDYAKLAQAVGKTIASGINVSLVDINSSQLSFEPDVKNNRILYGLKAISNINDEIINQIVAGRPYTGIKDFMTRCPLKKTATLNLIKAGAFDEVDTDFRNRKEIMVYFLMNKCDMKSKLNLQNFNGLVTNDLIPQELEFQIRIFNLNKYLKTRKSGDWYSLDDACLSFFNRFLPEEVDKFTVENGSYFIPASAWKKIYDKNMDVARDYLKNNQAEMLFKYNSILFKAAWDKYANEGNMSKQEMSAVCFYYHEHELTKVDNNKYGISDFTQLPRDPEVDYFFKRGGKQIPIYKLTRIAGTVLAKIDSKSTVTILTTTGVVDVKMTRDQYAKFKKQVSKVNPDGSKTILERSWFTRGNILIFTGYRTEDMFRVKTYTNTPSHSLYRITAIEGDEIKIVHDRVSGQGTIEEDEEGYY